MPRILNLQTFISEVLEREKQRVLVACFHWDGAMIEEMTILNSVSLHSVESLKTYVVDEDAMYAFREAFSIEGTPTFLLFEGGEERGRMLGHADIETLSAFIETK
jgi:hypothetical protein